MKRFTIIGGGIAGLTTAIALNKAGIETLIFEAAPEIKAIGAGLVLAANAIKAFQKLGISEEIVTYGRLLPSFSVYNQKGELITRTDSRVISKKNGMDNFTIHRSKLHALLLSKLSADKIQTNKRAIDIEQKGNSIMIKFQDGTSYETDFLIVADGIHSSIRKKLLPDSHPRYSGYTCWRAVIDNTSLKIDESSETWGGKGRFGIVPLAENKIYWFACINANQNDMRMKQFTINDLKNLFVAYHNPIAEILKETKDENLIWNDIIDLKPIRQYAFKNIVLIGDAAHATTPNLGQGACQAIEDAVILADEIKGDADIAKAFRSFEKRRLKRTHYIVNTSWKIGKVAQLENNILIAIRNFLFGQLPASFNKKQFKRLYEVDF